jgi:glycosyltransferase involved in cell wall biosynthesis
MKRLLIFSPSHALFGGVENIVNDLCRELPKHGWEAFLALAKGKRFHDVKRYREQHPGLSIVEVDGAKGTNQARLEAIEEIIREMNPDMVLCARIFNLYEVVVKLKEKFGAPRLAVTIQSYEPDYFFDARVYREFIDLCVTSGEMIRQALITWSGVAQENVVSIPGGVRSPLVPVGFRSPMNPLRIGYVGRLQQEQKRVLDLPKLLDRIEDLQIPYSLTIAGTGPAEPMLKNQLAKRIADGRVSILGWQSVDDLYRHVYPNLDCLIHFATYEGITIAPREAMIHGAIPVISEFTGLKTEGHFVNELNSLTFPVGDIALAAKQIQRLWTQPGLMEHLSAQAMHSQTGKYSFEGSIVSWSNEFTRTLDRPISTGKSPSGKSIDSGKLSRAGIPPWLAQRIRDLFGRSFTHETPGAEWPHTSGLLTADAAREIMEFAAKSEGAIHA